MRCVIVVILLLAVSSVGLAATIAVPGDYSSVLAAVDAAVAGDSVLVGPGTWSDIDTRTVVINGIPFSMTGFAVMSGNPTRGLVRVQLDIPAEAEGPWRVAVFDVRGRRVRELLAGPVRPGQHNIAWDLRDNGGLRAAPGMYFMSAAGPGHAATRRIVVVR